MSANSREFVDAIRDDRNHVWHHITQHKPMETRDPLVIVEGRGMRVWDAKGNECLDAVSGGVWTVNVGYGRAEIADAVRDQLVTLNYFAQTAGNVPASRFARRLIERMPGRHPAAPGRSGLRPGPHRGVVRVPNLLDNTKEMGQYLMQGLESLQSRHALVGDVRGKGLFAGVELVRDRGTKEPVNERVAIEVCAHCQNNGVIIGRTNRSLAGLNNTLCLSPALICTRDDIDRIVEALDAAIAAAHRPRLTRTGSRAV